MKLYPWLNFMVIHMSWGPLFSGESIYTWQNSMNNSEWWRANKSPELWHMDKSRHFGLWTISTDLRDRKLCLRISIVFLGARGPRPGRQPLGTQYSLLPSTQCCFWSGGKNHAKQWSWVCWCAFFLYCYGICEGTFWALSQKTVLYLAIAIWKFCLYLLFYIFVFSEVVFQKLRPSLISYKWCQSKCCFLCFT